MPQFQTQPCWMKELGAWHSQVLACSVSGTSKRVQTTRHARSARFCGAAEGTRWRKFSVVSMCLGCLQRLISATGRVFRPISRWIKRDKKMLKMFWMIFQWGIWRDHILFSHVFAHLSFALPCDWLLQHWCHNVPQIAAALVRHDSVQGETVQSLRVAGTTWHCAVGLRSESEGKVHIF